MRRTREWGTAFVVSEGSTTDSLDGSEGSLAGSAKSSTTGSATASPAGSATALLAGSATASLAGELIGSSTGSPGAASTSSIPSRVGAVSSMSTVHSVVVLDRHALVFELGVPVRRVGQVEKRQPLAVANAPSPPGRWGSSAAGWGS